MPLRCDNPITGQNIHAFDVTAEEWRALAEENKTTRSLRLPCCASEVVLKRSQRGTQFFAHKVKNNCATAPETEAHLLLKQMAVAAARAYGWDAATEIRGSTPDGEQWIADVLAQKGGHKVAVEIQWSGQTTDETLARQARYAKSGVRGLWLVRQSGLPISRDLPAAQIRGSSGDGYSALIPTGRSNKGIATTEFLDAAFGGRLKFGLPEGFEARVSVRGNDVECWSCHEHFRIIICIAVEYGPYSCEFTVPQLTDHPEVFAIIRERLPEDPARGAIKQRHSKTQERSYLSNGCSQCDALFGEEFEPEYRYGETIICEFVTPALAPWCRAISEDREDTQRWGIYQRF